MVREVAGSNPVSHPFRQARSGAAARRSWFYLGSIRSRIRRSIGAAQPPASRCAVVRDGRLGSAWVDPRPSWAPSWGPGGRRFKSSRPDRAIALFMRNRVDLVPVWCQSTQNAPRCAGPPGRVRRAGRRGALPASGRPRTRPPGAPSRELRERKRDGSRLLRGARRTPSARYGSRVACLGGRAVEHQHMEIQPVQDRNALLARTSPEQSIVRYERGILVMR